MKKLKLNLDEIKVESFTVNNGQQFVMGTVKGQKEETDTCYYQAGNTCYDCYETSLRTCPVYDSCQTCNECGTTGCGVPTETNGFGGVGSCYFTQVVGCA